MIYEANRLKSYVNWPFKDGTCTKERAARAGFYNTNIPGEIDGVRCFCCFKELDGFQRDEDPWIEHQKHNNDCEFVRLGKPEYQQTMEEFIKIVMERQINIINKQFQQKKKIADDKLKLYGLNGLNEL